MGDTDVCGEYDDLELYVEGLYLKHLRILFINSIDCPRLGFGSYSFKELAGEAIPWDGPEMMAVDGC